MVKYLVLRMGYAETGSATFMILQNTSGYPFATLQDALRDLAANVFEKYVIDHKQCGHNMKDVPLDRESLVAFLESLHYGSCSDGWGTEDLNGWWPWIEFHDVMKNATVDEVLVVPDSAAQIVMNHLNPEDVSEEYRSIVQNWNWK